MEEETFKQVLLIAGPTASGKSSAAITLAEEVGGEIINGDAMQVYADLRVLTARPDTEDEARVPHHLYGVLDGGERCSAGRWARLAVPVIDEVLARGRVPIVVGGTGLYLRSLVEGLSPMPEIEDTFRARGNDLYREVGGEAFHDLVVARDPAMAHLAPGDRQRLVRAWEVVEATGRPLSDWQKTPPLRLLPHPYRAVVLLPPREAIYANCDGRFEKMIAAGALDEVRALMARGLDPTLPVMKSLGVPELAAHLAGALTLDEAIEQATMNTRRFAKRQMTWFRNQCADWVVAKTGDDLVAQLSGELLGNKKT